MTVGNQYVIGPSSECVRTNTGDGLMEISDTQDQKRADSDLGIGKSSCTQSRTLRKLLESRAVTMSDQSMCHQR